MIDYYIDPRNAFDNVRNHHNKVLNDLSQP